MMRIFLKKWFFILVLSSFSLFIYFRTEVIFFYFFFWIIVVATGLSFLWLFLEYILVNLSFLRKMLTKITEDDTLEIELTIKNNTFFPLFNFIIQDFLSCVYLADKEKRTWIDYLGPKQSRIIRYSCLCYKRGRYLIGPLTLYLFDPFNLFYLKKTYFLYNELYVYPRTFNIQKFPPLLKGIQPWFGIETIRVSGDEDEFFATREYTRGDPIKRIHWLSSARKNMLIVKEFQRQSFFRATIIFNLEEDKNFGEGKHTVCEYMIKIAASVAKYLIEKGVSIEIIAHIGEVVHIPFNKGTQHLEDILRFLTVAEARSKISLAEFFQEYTSYIPNDSNLIVIMTDEDWHDLPLMLSLKARNISLIPLVLILESFLYPLDKEKIFLKAKSKLSNILELNGKFFSYKDNFEEIFSY